MLQQQVPFEYIKAAAIGYWRMGAETKLISLITGIEELEVEEIIYQYQNKTQCNQHNKFMAV